MLQQAAASTPLGSGGVGLQAPLPMMVQQHGGMVGYFSPSFQQQQQQQQPQAMAAMSMGYQQAMPAMSMGQYMYVDPATGHLVPAMPSMMTLQGQPMQMFGQQPMQLMMQQGGGMVAFHPGMHIMHSMPMAESPTKKPKRKRAPKGETSS